MTRASVPIAPVRVEHKILLLRGERVTLDADLAVLYGAETRSLVRAVKRNEARFPPDFMFQLTADEGRAPLLSLPPSRSTVSRCSRRCCAASVRST